jgi:hypothetical protein
MTVLAADIVTPMKDAGLKSFPAGVDILYKGGFALINPDGYAVAAPVAASCQGMVMAGVIAEKVDNSGGSAGDKNVRVYTEGFFKFTATSITQAMVGQMMYLVDDNIFDDEPGEEQIPVGILVEYVSATSGWIDIGAATGLKTAVKRKAITKAAAYTVLEEESGAVFFGNLDAITFTLPATKKGLTYTFVNKGADGAMLINIDPNAADLIVGNDLVGSDGGILSNTKATAKRADCVTLVGDGDIGWYIVSSIGVWAIA